MVLTPDKLKALLHKRGTWLSCTVSWTVQQPEEYNTRFDYYAGWSEDLQRWFLTGPADWYQTRNGITTEELCQLLEDERPTSVWVSSDWTEVYYR